MQIVKAEDFPEGQDFVDIQTKTKHGGTENIYMQKERKRDQEFKLPPGATLSYGEFLGLINDNGLKVSGGLFDMWLESGVFDGCFVHSITGHQYIFHKELGLERIKKIKKVYLEEKEVDINILLHGLGLK